MQNKIKIMENLHYSFNLLRRNKHQNKDFIRGKGRLFSLLKENETNGITQGELAEKLRVQPSSMSELIQKLEHHGFITKKQDENDRRSFKVFLTAEGHDKITEIKAEKARFIDALFKDFSSQDTESLSALLEKLTLSLKEFSEQQVDERHHQHDHKEHHGHRHGRHHHGDSHRHHHAHDNRIDKNSLEHQ
ncbi:MarR family transcriptional regulator [Orbus sturtevantii]|uniref:MarR family winged helix-turn-helix transcriptional regulator n=1 Tax=Orbus sturtevantii TaxID=3074109 RepID=UPI00370D1FFC